MGDIGRGFAKETDNSDWACKVCDGSGYDDNPNELVDCESCDGTGVKDE
jgi:DnaJ-class molecular chaperone